MTAADAITLARLHLDEAWVHLATMLTVYVVAPVVRHMLDRRRPCR